MRDDDLTVWSRAYEDSLARRHRNLMELARLRRSALTWTAGLFLVALAAAAGATIVDGWLQAVAVILAGTNLILAGAHRMLVRRIDQQVTDLDLTIEFGDARHDIGAAGSARPGVAAPPDGPGHPSAAPPQDQP